MANPLFLPARTINDSTRPLEGRNTPSGGTRSVQCCIVLDAKSPFGTSVQRPVPSRNGPTRTSARAVVVEQRARVRVNVRTSRFIRNPWLMSDGDLPFVGLCRQG